MNWVSVHLFYTNYDKLLKDGVLPFIQNLKAKDFIEKWFFIRYEEGGQHLRLRILPLVEKTILKQEIIDFFTLFFKKNPSFTFSENTVFPNNSIQFIDYEPEVNRYGGKYGLRISENFFQKSSEFALEQTPQSYQDAFTTALIGHYLLALNFRIENKSCFFKKIHENWLQFLVEKLDVTSSEILTHFDRLFLEQKKSIENLITLVNEAFTAQELNNYQQWSDVCASTALALQSANLTLPPAVIAESYLHLLNNRLGVSNFDESFLGYLLWKTTK